MALYRFVPSIVSFAKGGSAVHRAAYNAREQLEDKRQGGVTKDYSNREDLAWSGIFAPKNAPEWVHDRAELWNRAEAAERWKTKGQPVREFDIALPNELTREQQKRLATDYFREQFARKGMIADVCLHSDFDAEGHRINGRESDPRNDHLHVLATTRRLDGENFARTKTDAREWNSEAQFQEWCQQWGKHGAKALRKAGFELEASRFEVGYLPREEQRKLAIERGDREWAEHLEREPTKHLGPHIAALEEKGIPTALGNENRAIREQNRELAEARAELREVSREIEREQEQERERKKAAHLGATLYDHGGMASQQRDALRDHAERQRLAEERRKRETESPQPSGPRAEAQQKETGDEQRQKNAQQTREERLAQIRKELEREWEREGGRSLGRER